MTQIRLYLDEDTMDSALLTSLRHRNVDVLSTREAQMLSRSDEEQLQWALEHQRVIYSFNVRDFYRIHTNWVEKRQNHSGIILGFQNYSMLGENNSVVRCSCRLGLALNTVGKFVNF